MNTINYLRASALLFISTACSVPHAADQYPSRSIRFVVGFLPGGPSDIIARTVGQKLAELVKYPVIVDNRAGAGGILSADIVAHAQPDGHTLLLGTGAPLVMAPILGQKVNFNPEKDFLAITKLADSMSILCAHPSLPVNGVRELIEYARTRPGEVTYASSGIGVSNHLAAELLSSMANIKMLHVPYKGSGAALPALLGGQVKIGFGPLLPAIPHVKSGRLKALGVSGLKRSSGAPDIPTVAEQGLPGFEVNSWYGVFVPAQTPKPVAALIHKHFNTVLAMQDVKDKLAAQGVEVSGGTPEQLTAIIQNEKKIWSKVIKQANIKVE